MALPATERIVPVAVTRIELEAAVPFGTLRRAFEAEVPPLDAVRLHELLSTGAEWRRLTLETSGRASIASSGSGPTTPRR